METDHDQEEVLIARAIGKELRRARESIGWTRSELASRMRRNVHPQTIATYERGIRQCTVGRFVELCRTMRMPASEILVCGLQRDAIALETNGIRVDLHSIIKDRRAALQPLRTWARTRVEDIGEPGVVHLEWAILQEMAALFGMKRTELVKHLITFTPLPAPRPR